MSPFLSDENLACDGLSGIGQVLPRSITQRARPMDLRTRQVFRLIAIVFVFLIALLRVDSMPLRADDWPVRAVLLSGDVIETELTGWTAQGPHLSNSSLASEELLRLEFLPEQSERLSPPFVLFANGDCLTFHSLTIVEEQAELRRDSGGTLRFPLSELVSISYSRSDVNFGRRIPAAMGSDVCWLQNADRVAGEFQKLTPNELLMKTVLGEVSVPVEAIQLIAFNPDLIEPRVPSARRVIVTWTSGESITADAISMKPPDAITIEVSQGQKLEAELRNICQIDFRGKRVVPLWNAPVAQAESESYFGEQFAPVTDTLHYEPQPVGGVLWPRCVVTRPRTILTYSVPATAKWFHGRVGMLDRNGFSGAADVRILLDQQTVWTDDDVTVADGLIDLRPISVEGVRHISLVADFGPLADIADHLVWVDPLFVLSQAPPSTDSAVE